MAPAASHANHESRNVATESKRFKGIF